QRRINALIGKVSNSCENGGAPVPASIPGLLASGPHGGPRPVSEGNRGLELSVQFIGSATTLLSSDPLMC
ncbi:MAG TPA: hypothetical protein VHX15_12870, partial [Frankiaceae bacterium]|nr:hypothetical protein [Frankiaceae bacterium]